MHERKMRENIPVFMAETIFFPQYFYSHFYFYFLYCIALHIYNFLSQVSERKDSFQFQRIFCITVEKNLENCPQQFFEFEKFSWLNFPAAIYKIIVGEQLFCYFLLKKKKTSQLSLYPFHKILKHKMYVVHDMTPLY